MKKYERSWILWTIFLSIINLFLIFIFIITKTEAKISLLFFHVNTCIIIFLIYSIVSSRKVRIMEDLWQKKGKECFCYVYHHTQGDNGSIVYDVVVHLEMENINKLEKYQSFTNIKLRNNQVVKGYYYENKVVLDNKNIDVKNLPQNIIETFELNDENII